MQIRFFQFLDVVASVYLAPSFALRVFVGLCLGSRCGVVVVVSVEEYERLSTQSEPTEIQLGTSLFQRK